MTPRNEHYAHWQRARAAIALLLVFAAGLAVVIAVSRMYEPPISIVLSVVGGWGIGGGIRLRYVGREDIEQ